MSKKGWISIHRSMADHWLWKKEKFTKGQAWIDLILSANHKENKALIKGQLIKVGRGQQIRSQVTLAKTWKWDRKTVHRFLKLLESDSMIVQHSTHLTTIITICNYSEFQDLESSSPHLKGQVEGQVSGHTVPKCRGTNNNDNNANNVNNDNKEQKDLFDSFWKNYPKKSDKKKAETAFNRLGKEKKQKATSDCKTRYSGTDKKYIPLATTYIHGERWDDEIEKSKSDNHNGFAEKNYQEGATNIDSLEWMK